MATVQIVSASLLDGNPNAYGSLFAPLRANTVNFFDEGPVLKKKTQTLAAVTGAINTEITDPYVQGVEIQNMSQYDAGLFKIWSGEPGHIMKQAVFGQSQATFPSVGFVDAQDFFPQQYVNAQAGGSPLWTSNLAYPLVVGNKAQLETLNFNNVIEPITIRNVASLTTTDPTGEAHAIKATLMGANTNIVGAAARVLTVDTYAPNKQVVGYLDLVDCIGIGSGTKQLVGYFQWLFTTLTPFADIRYSRNQATNTFEDATLVDAMDHMTGSTANYLRINERSATCGWVYDTTVALGTDSIAFGGQTY